MTFLQFLLSQRQYCGEPSRTHADGVSYWPCPVCGSSSFHTLPIRGHFRKERAKCWNPECGFRGDWGDMLKEFHPDETYDERLDRRAQLELLYQKQNTKRPARKGRGK
jgi:hypothetical protein